MINLYTAYESDLSSHDPSTGFTIENSIFGAVKSAKNDDGDKYSYLDMVPNLMHYYLFYCRVVVDLENCNNIMKLILVLLRLLIIERMTSYNNSRARTEYSVNFS